MTLPLRLIPASSPEWDEWMRPVPSDFPHSAAYHRFSEDCGEGAAFLLVCGTRDRFLAWPYLLRRIAGIPGLEAGACHDVTSVYGYPGPLLHGRLDDGDFLTRAWDAVRDTWREQRAVSAFTRFNPVLENHRWLAPDGSGCGVRLSGRTISIDLRRSDEDIRRNYRRQLRQHINRGRQAGLVTEVDQDWSRLDDFLRIYTRTMARNCADRRYFFTRDYFERLRRALGPAAFLLVTRLGGRPAAAGFVVEYNGIVNPHLAGSEDEFLHLSPFKVFLDDLRRWGQQRGNHTLHLGGGRGGAGDSLFRFKSEFSPRAHTFHTGGWVLDQDAYDWLCGQRRRYASETGLCADQTDFFPAYRAPLNRPAAVPAAVVMESAG